MSDRFYHLRLIEALLFASAEPIGRDQIARLLPEDVAAEPLIEELTALYANRGVNLVPIGDRWAFRTAPDIAPAMQIETSVVRKPSRAAVETLAVIAYHQPVTRAEIEEIRGVALSKGTLDTLLEMGWIRPRGRRRTPGRPVTWATSEAFLDHFGLESLDSLPGVAELKAAGLIDSRPAMTALSARGRLLMPGEEAVDTEAPAPEREEDAIEDMAAALEAAFGEDAATEEDESDDGDVETDETDETLEDAEGVGAAQSGSTDGPSADAVSDVEDDTDEGEERHGAGAKAGAPSTDARLTAEDDEDNDDGDEDEDGDEEMPRLRAADALARRD